MFLNQQDRFFLGGYQDFLFDFDINRRRILRQINISDEQKDVILIKSSTPTSSQDQANSRARIICTGSTSGQIILRDPFTLKSLHKFQPHSGTLSDFAVHENSLISCGLSLNRSGNLSFDRFLMQYDLRMMKALPPIQLLIEPSFLHYLPMCSSVVGVASQAGCFQFIDTNIIAPSTFYQAQMIDGEGIATTFSMSSNCQTVAFGHSTGFFFIHF
jgi:PAB-dependent poly(A)-specific ribonuclease subunit 2